MPRLIVDTQKDLATQSLFNTQASRPYTTPAGALTKTTTLNANHTPSFKMNSLLSREYETVPLKAGHIPGCTVFVPGGADGVIGQRRAQATLHTQELRPLTAATKGNWQDAQLIDLRPQERAYNKEYIYAENLQSSFLKFPTRKTFDHRRI